MKRRCRVFHHHAVMEEIVLKKEHITLALARQGLPEIPALTKVRVIVCNLRVKEKRSYFTG